MTAAKNVVPTLDSDSGELTLHTGVTGRGALMGHRLTILMTRWRVSVDWAGEEPASSTLTVDVDALEVVRGEGGPKGLSAPEKALVRSNALKSLGAKKFPEIRFTADEIQQIQDGYRLAGTLHICGKSRPHQVDVRTEDLGDSWRLSAESAVRQTDFGVKPFSMFMGSLKVADEVALSFSADWHKEV
ncbi:YceI family protein [Mycobacterium sp.]|uniref:YceI family protein n=1 Tax=Mycobacterium sp. TaxID=1785 RepID=UPI003A89C584